MSGKKAAAAGGNKGGKGEAKTIKKAEPKANTAAKPKAPAAKATESAFKRADGNPFRAGSAYAKVFDILAAHNDGMRRDELVKLLAKDTGKDERLAAYNVQVILSAKPNENGLNNNDSPRHRACRKGFYVKRENDHVKLMID